jgi:uroporphyrinogen decarboxylase
MADSTSVPQEEQIPNRSPEASLAANEHLNPDLAARSGLPQHWAGLGGAHFASQQPSRFVRACLRQPVDRTPVWFLRQAGRYMAEYQAVRRHHSLLDICKRPELAAEVTITAAEKLGVDAAIIFADLLLPFEAMGLDFEFLAGEGPVVHQPVRSPEAVARLRTDRAAELGYVGEAIRRVAAHFEGRTHDDTKDALGIIGFIGAPFTLASYMIEGSGSRQYINTKTLMYREPAAWQLLMEKLTLVLREYAQQQVDAGADVIQIFDSWAGALSLPDYREFVLPPTTTLVREVQAMGVPVIYFGVDTASLLPSMGETGADVLGLDWRTPLARTWRDLDYRCAVQGNLDPIALFAEPDLLDRRVQHVLDQAAGRPGHIFNLGHGIVPGTPVENVQHVVQYVRQHRRALAESARTPDFQTGSSRPAPAAAGSRPANAHAVSGDPATSTQPTLDVWNTPSSPHAARVASPEMSTAASESFTRPTAEAVSSRSAAHPGFLESPESLTALSTPTALSSPQPLEAPATDCTTPPAPLAARKASAETGSAPEAGELDSLEPDAREEE